MHRLLGLLFIGVAIACAPLAWAKDPTPPVRPQATEMTGISLVQAIANIESASGGRVILAEVNPPLQPPTLPKVLMYELMTLQGRTVKLFFVDAESGKVLAQYGKWMRILNLNGFSKDPAFAQAALSLQQAIPRAERETGGRTVLAATKMDKGNAYYQITVVNNVFKRVLVDAHNGTVTEVPLKPIEIFVLDPQHNLRGLNLRPQ